MANTNDNSSPIVIARRRFLQRDLSDAMLQQGKRALVQNQQFQQSVLLEEQQGAGVSSYLNQEVALIRKNTDIELKLKTVGLGFYGRTVALTPATPAIIIPTAKTPRGYLILNPAEISGFTTQVTFFPSLLRAGAAAPGNDFLSTTFNVSGVDTARMWLDITAIVGVPTVRVDAQTQDSLTGNFATSQTDIFSGASTVGTFYASIGALGVDRVIRLLANVTGAATSVTFSISGLFKGATLSPVGSTIFIGGTDVNATWGYPILPGQEKVFYLLDNVQLYAITPTEPLTVKVFQLQG